MRRSWRKGIPTARQRFIIDARKAGKSLDEIVIMYQQRFKTKRPDIPHSTIAFSRIDTTEQFTLELLQNPCLLQMVIAYDRYSNPGRVHTNEQANL